MKKNQHITDEKTYRRFIKNNKNIFMFKNNSYLPLDWSDFNNKIQKEYYWEDERFKENEIEDKLSLFERQWGLLRQLVLNPEIKDYNDWQILYFILLFWLKAKIDEYRTILFRGNNDNNKSDKIKLLKLLDFFSLYYNNESKEIGPKILSKEEFLPIFFQALDKNIMKNMFWSYPLITEYEITDISGKKKQKLELENLDFDNHIFWFVREMMIYTPHIFLLERSSPIVPFERKVDLDFLYNSDLIKINYFKDLISTDYNVLYKYKYFYWLDEYIYFGYQNNIKELCYDYKCTLEKAQHTLFETNSIWLNKIINSTSFNDKLEMFLEMIGGWIMPLSNKNNAILSKLELYFFVMQNQLENCLFLFNENEFLNYKNIIDEHKTEIIKFYEGYNFS